MISNLILLLFLAGSLAIPVEETNVNLTEFEKNNCFDVMKNGGASSHFGGLVGHTVHSFHLRWLKKFEPTATEVNFVPTINLNLNAWDAILEHAPNRNGPSGDMFITDGMKSLDEILSHMDDKDYEIYGYTTIERVAHTFHMEEAWAKAKIEYEKIKASPPSEQFCTCAMNIEENGVLKMLRFSALEIREPQLVYGNKLGLNKPGQFYIDYSHSKYTDNSKGLTPKKILQKSGDAMPKLNGTDGWNQWKQIHYSMPMNEAGKDTALFIYCALKKAGTL